MYQIPKYKDKITDEGTRKRYEMVEKLSRGFTVEHTTALAIDKLLVEQIELEAQEPHVSDPVEKKEKEKKVTASVLPDNLEQVFQELYDALKEQSPQFAHREKVGYSDLDTDMQNRVASKPILIQYVLPTVTTAPFPDPDIDDFQRIVDDVLLGNNVFLIGGAGTGKTYLAENLVAGIALSRQHMTINCSQWTAPTEIIGGQTMDGYVEGKLIEAWKNGYILILDELPKIDPNTAGLFNDALAKTKIPGAVIFNGRKESFKKHDHFGCIATGSVYPDKESVLYGANNRQDLSLLDRFSGSVYFIEKNPAIEKRIIENNMIWSIADRIRGKIEQMKYEAQLSLRFMLNARDSYLLEMQRIKDKSKAGIAVDKGKTFKSTLNSFLSTFTEIQRQNIKEDLRYQDLFETYHYRSLNSAHLIQF